MTDTSHDDLVRQLRDLGDHASFEPHMHHTAADRIEELSNCVAVLEAKLAQQDDLVQAAVAAKLREAAEAAEDYHSDLGDWLAKHGHSVSIRDYILAFITPDAQAALDRYVKERSDEVVAAERERWQSMSMVGFANQMTTRSIAAIREGSNERSEEGE
jgi:hypothetical protein